MCVYVFLVYLARKSEQQEGKKVQWMSVYVLDYQNLNHNLHVCGVLRNKVKQSLMDLQDTSAA